MNYKEMITRRAQVWAQMQEVQSRSNLLEAEDRRQWDELETELEQLSQAIERIERSDRLSAAVAATDTPIEGRGEDRGDDAYARTFAQYVKRGMGALDVDQRQMLMDAMIDAPELRAQSAGTAATGGYAVPEGFWNKVTDAMKAYGGILSIANVIPTNSGNDIPWPTVDDTNNEGVLVAENTQMTDATDITFAQNKLGAYMFSSKPIRASLQFIQDTAIDAEDFVAGKAGMRLGRALAGYLATGTGTSQPKGVTNFAVGKQGAAGQTTSITYDDVIDLIHSVNSAYRGSNCRFVMADNTVKVFRKMKDGEGRPLWQPSLQLGTPSTLLDYAIQTDDKLPAMSAGAKSIGFGDFKLGFVVRQVNGGGLLRLEERYADYLQVGFITFARYDSTIDDANAVRLYQNAAS